MNIINSISFENFYNYFGSYKTNTYKFKKGLNVIVADNGAGKSKFFNGILWLLKDMVYDSELKKEDKIENAVFIVISDKAKDETSVGDKIKIGVKLSYQDIKHEYIVEKYYYAKRTKQGNSLDEECWELEKIKQDISKRDLYLKTFNQVYDIEDQNRIIRNIILPGLRPYALLQGEEIDNIINFSMKNSLNEAINKLTNINRIKDLVILSDYLLNRSMKDLDSQRKLHTKSARGMDEELLNKKSLKSELIKNEKLLQATISTLNKSNEEISKLLNSIATAEKRSEFRKVISDLDDELQSLSEEFEEFLNGINSYFFIPEYSWLLMDLDGEMRTFSDIRDEYLEKRMKQKLSNELKMDTFTTVLPDGSPDFVSLEKMLDQEICFVCGRETEKDSEAWLYMKNVKDRPKNKLPEEHSSKNDFKDFFGDIQMNAQGYYRKIVGINESVKKLRSDAADYDGKIRKNFEQKELAEQELFQFGGSTTKNIKKEKEKEKDKNILESYANANQRIGQCEIEIERYKRKADSLQISLEDVDKKIAELGGSDLPKEYEATTELLTDINKIIGNAKERIFSEILTRLEINANMHFQNLIVGNNADGGILKLTKTSSETVRLEVVDKNNNLIHGSSEGFQRMKKLAVIMAIISSRSGSQTFDYPLIADAPLSAFGKGFTEGFFSEVPNVFNQSIILVKELYDKDRKGSLTETGEMILNNPDIGSFYLNEVEENKSQYERETKINCYK